jgi:hypothetical protein
VEAVPFSADTAATEDRLTVDVRPLRSAKVCGTRTMKLLGALLMAIGLAAMVWGIALHAKCREDATACCVSRRRALVWVAFHMARSRFNDPIEPMTLQNMRDNGVRSLAIRCFHWHQKSALSKERRLVLAGSRGEQMRAAYSSSFELMR